MSTTYTARDREASRKITKLFWQANLIARKDLIIWALTRPLAVLIYTVLIPLVTAYAIQAVVIRDFEKVPQYAWAIFAMGTIYCVLWAIGGYTVSRGGVAGTLWIQRKIFDNYLRKDYEFLNDSHLGALGAQATRLRDAYNEYNILVLNTGLRLALIIVVSIGIIAFHSWALALITILSMLCILSFTIVSGRWRLKYRRELSETNSETAGVISDALSQSITVKSFAAEEYENDRLNKSLDKLARSQFLSWTSSIPADIGRIFLASVAMAALLLLTAHLYQQNSIPIAVVVLIQLYVIRLVVATSELADFLKSYESIMSAAHSAVKTMLAKSYVLDPAKPKKFSRQFQPTLEIGHMTYRYPEAPVGVAAIQDMDVDIKAGERVGLVGYSGSGKTTLTKLLLRFMDVSEGAIRIGGLDIRDVSQAELRRRISYVPQEPLLFHRSIFDNIAYGRPGASREDIKAAGKAAYVDEFVEEMSKGYDTIVGEKGVKLSGGQRQRVAIARALLKDAPILVLDEATSALDSKSEQFIQKALWKLMKGRTALVIAHRLSTIQRMDRIIVMDKGRVVATGTHEELLKDENGIYAQLWAHQSGGYIGKQTVTE